MLNVFAYFLERTEGQSVDKVFRWQGIAFGGSSYELISGGGMEPRYADQKPNKLRIIRVSAVRDPYRGQN